MQDSLQTEASTDADAVAGKLAGRIDRSEGNTVIGWAAWRGDSERRVEVKLLIDGHAVRQQAADEYRPDVEDAGIGDGHCGFALAIPDRFRDGKLHTVEVLEASLGLPLVGGPLEAMLEPLPSTDVAPQHGSTRAGLAEPPLNVAAPTRPHEIDGRLDACGPGGVRGWALRLNGSRQAVDVELLIDGAPVARATADRHRADLAAAGIGSGHHAYRLMPPDDVFDGEPREVVVREVSTGEQLVGSPMVARFDALDLWLLAQDDDALRRRHLADRALSHTEELADVAFDAARHAALLELLAWLRTQPRGRSLRRAQALVDRCTRLRCRLVFNGLTSARDIAGHIEDSWTPDETLVLQLLEDDRVVAEVELPAAKTPGAGRAFSFTLPESMLDDDVHRLHLRVQPHGGLLGPWSLLLVALPAAGADAAVPTDPVWDSTPAVLALRRRQKAQLAPTAIEFARQALADAMADDDAEGDDREALLALRVHHLLELGRALQAAGEWPEALAQFDRARELDPENFGALTAGIRCLLAHGDEAAAEARIAQALDADPDASELHWLADELQGRRRVKGVRTLAFYLPQFHPTPENDAWWGQGFTEWHNVGGAAPLFDGHLQPRRPTALGYYDLRLPEAADAQFELARRYGIDGFCYYYYWFEGRRILERPLQDLAAGRTGPFPFCICWANEDWTRSWDGSSGDVLLAQNHSPESDFAFIQDLAPLLRHPDYIRVEGKPMVLIYRADKLATPLATVQRWREWCREQGIGELYLCAVQSFGFHDPRPLGFDAAVEFPPHCPWDRYPEPPYLTTPSELPARVAGFNGIVYDYQSFAKAAMARQREPFTLHRTSMVAWDNTARRGKSAAIYHGFTTATFEGWALANARRAAVEQRDGVCFVNAWNEWAEGTVMEPDVHFGHQILETVREVQQLANFDAQATYWRTGRPLFPENRLEPRQRVLLIGHDAFPSGAQTNMLNMARTLKRQLDIDVSLMLVEGGELLPEFEKVASTYVIGKADAWRSGLQLQLRQYAALGACKAICNTVITGDVCEVLKQEGYKVVGLLHELPTLIEAYGLQAQCWRFADKTDAIVGASQLVADEFAHRYWPDPRKMLIAPQGIAFNRYHATRDETRALVREELGLPATCRIVLGCGYGDTRKGIDLFVQMAGEVARRSEPGSVAFVWVGAIDPPMAPYVNADALRLGVAECFRVTGRTDDPARYFIAGDVFTLTSREDPFPSVVMEAFDARMPVVAFAGGGGYVDIVGAATGALVPYLDVTAMAQAVAGYLADATRLEQVGRSNHAACRQRFGYEPYLRKLLALLADVPAEQVAAGHLQRQAWFSQRPRPRITAIVPNYNYARYLELRLNSIIGQTLPPDEIIVLDDASTDASLEIIRAVAARSPIPLQVIANERNTGNPFVQWANGLERASGELVWIAESDDYCEPTLLETLAHELADDKVVMAWADSIMVDDAGHSQGAQYKDYYARSYGAKWRTHFRMAGRELIEDCLFSENVLPNASAVLFRRAAVNFDLAPLHQYRFSGDWWFWLFLARGGDVVYRADPLNYHRRHAKSVMGDVLRSGQALLPETIGFYQRLAQAAPDCISERNADMALGRLDKLYAMFPALQDHAATLGRHSEFAPAHAALATTLRAGLASAVRAPGTRTAATLVLSLDVLGADNSSGLRLRAELMARHVLQLVVLAPEAATGTATDSDNVPEAWGLPVDAAVAVIRPSAAAMRAGGDAVLADLSPALAKALPARAPRVISHGLLAHCAVAGLPTEAVAHWLLVADAEFDALQGRTSPLPGVDMPALARALGACSQASYMGTNAPHVFGRLAQLHARPLARLALRHAGVAQRRRGAGPAAAVLAVAAGVEPDAWIQVADGFAAAAARHSRRLTLRLMAWGNDLIALQTRGAGHPNLELVGLFAPPGDLDSLADARLTWQSGSDASASLRPALPRSQLPAVSLPWPAAGQAWGTAAAVALDQWLTGQGTPPKNSIDALH